MSFDQPTARPALRVKELRKSFKDVVALRGVHFEVREGECFGLLGPNGAGKTTFIEICEGLLPPDSGELVLLGRRWKDHPRYLRQRIGVQLQETQFSDKLTAGETIRLFRSFYPRGPSPDQLIAVAELEEKRDARVGSLSGGQKQRLALACALAGDPDVLFLDEPTTGLDPQARRQLWAVIDAFRRSGRTILLTTHYMDEAERLCDRVAIIDRGRIIALGAPHDLIASMGAAHVIDVSFEPSAPRLATAALSRIVGIQDIRRYDDGIRLMATELHETVPALLRELARQGIALTGLQTRSASLEDVFVALTGRSLQ
jgi:ABC-2 type transport system ATP-binding protein